MSKAAALTTFPGSDVDSKATLGFWIYIMTDCVLFASLFATYAVLHGNTNGGPSGQQLFSLHYVLVETLLLLTSSFTCGLGMLAAQGRNIDKIMNWFGATFCFGLIFLAMEVVEFSKLASEGHSWHHSGFLSSYFTLVGTHGLHIAIGLLWMGIVLLRIRRRGLTPVNNRGLTLLSLFWHFLDLIWIFIFTIVYLFGAIPL